VKLGRSSRFVWPPGDAPIIAREFSPDVSAEDLVGLPSHNILLKLMIDGAACRAFSSTTLLPGGDRPPLCSASITRLARGHQYQ